MELNFETYLTCQTIASLDAPFAEIASYLIWSASKIIRRHGFRYCLVGDRQMNYLVVIQDINLTF